MFSIRRVKDETPPAEDDAAWADAGPYAEDDGRAYPGYDTQDYVPDQPGADAPAWQEGPYAEEDPYAELERLMQAKAEGRPVDYATDLADELGVGHGSQQAGWPDLQPVDLRTGGLHPGGGHASQSYDQWDDAALDQLADELSTYDDYNPQHGGSGVLPPHSAAEEDVAPGHGGRRWLVPALLAGALVVAVGGGYAAMPYLTGDKALGEPVFVAAPKDPFRIVPEAGDTIDEPQDNAAVFDPSGALPPKGEERLIAREGGVPDLADISPQVNRVILPNGEEIAAEGDQPVDTGPRRVRTVLVKPDGTIIESPDGPPPSLPQPTDPALTINPGNQPADTSPIAEAIAGAEGEGIAAALPPVEPAPDEAPVVPTPADVGDTVAALPDLPGDPAPGDATAGDPAAVEVANAPRPRPRPAPPAEAAAAAEPAAVAETPAPAEPVQAAPEPAAPVAQPATDGPLDLAATAATQDAAPAPAAAAPAPAGSAFVQLSSQRSEAAALAAFRDLQARHPGLLGGLAPDVQRADLGTKGIYYRVRVAQPTRGEAGSLCTSLKSAGADCLIANR